MKLDMVVEIPTGSKIKLEWDEKAKLMRFKRELLYGMVTNYGFFPNTLSPDKDPLDAILLAPPLASNCVVAVKPIGLLHLIDGPDVDDKVLCVLAYKPKWSKLKYVPNHLLNEIEHYFTIYKQLDQKKVVVKGWKDSKYTKRIIKQAQEAYKSNGTL
jgi:inorganic pyrophosphatase